jgi:hypothetical protein
MVTIPLPGARETILNRYAVPFLLSYVALLGTLVLSGCSGFDTASLAPSTPDKVTIGKIQGSVFGGHAPIIGNHVFLLQAGVGGYGTTATSLLSATYETGSAYPTAEDTTGDVTNGDYYVTSDSTGSFNISGDYTCTAGLPVYLYASGGTSAIEPSSAITSYSIASNVVTFISSNLLSAGQQVTVSGIADTTLDTTLTVSTSTLTSFTASLTHADVATTSVTATVAPVLTSNPAIVELAVLGNCPTSGAANFSFLNFIYMNEVSTVSATYSLSSFFSNSATALTSTDAAHLAIPGGTNLTDAAALLGIQNAANNAAQIYDIQGNGAIGTGGDGDTHIANATTPSGGTVPQALVNSLANTLAACVDSGDSASVTSTACSTLFADSKSAGATGTAPTDIATAAINMAHNPWNPNVASILGIASSSIEPFLPVASSAHDLAIGIFWQVSATSTQTNSNIAIDAQGNPWYLENATGSVSKLTPLGALTTNTVLQGATRQAIDTNGNDWVSVAGSGQGITELNNDGTVMSGSPFLTTTFGNAGGIAIDGTDTIYVANESGSGTEEITALSNANPPTILHTYSGVPCDSAGYNLALDGSSNLWALANNSTNGVCEFSGTSDVVLFSDLTGFKLTADIAIDSSGNGWLSDAGATAPAGLYKISPAGAETALSGGGLNAPNGLAVDGAGLIFTGNSASTSGGAIAIYNSATSAFLTGATGLTGSYVTEGTTEYVLTSMGTSAEPATGLAVDGSGDLWVANGSSQDLTEILGVATPVLTPLSAQIVVGKTASKP